jgi:acyl-CoA synthetase (AMP-forming)/AMP-acid ligase II
MIISGGGNIYPQQIEEYLLTHGGIRDIAVVGIPVRSRRIVVYLPRGCRR